MLHYKGSQGNVPLGPQSYHVNEDMPVTVISTSKLSLVCTIKIIFSVQHGCTCKVVSLQVVTQEPRLFLPCGSALLWGEWVLRILSIQLADGERERVEDHMGGFL